MDAARRVRRTARRQLWVEAAAAAAAAAKEMGKRTAGLAMADMLYVSRDAAGVGCGCMKSLFARHEASRL